MGKGKEIFLLRHGLTGLPGAYVGSMDVPLSTDGITQMERLRETTGNLQVDTIISSPMLRCRQSCEIVRPGAAYVCDDELREIDFGRWEGLTFAEIVARDQELVDRWAEWSLDFSFPGGESIGEFVNRVRRSGRRLAALDGKRILVVSHGGVVRALICYYLGLSPDNYLFFQVDKGKIARLEIHGEMGVLCGLNMTEIDF